MGCLGELASRFVTDGILNTKPMATPTLFVTVDVEEIFDWNEFSEDKIEVPSTLGLQQFQDVCSTYGVKPIYFITYPILCDEPLASELNAFLDAGVCEVGIHIHTWTTPPHLPSYDLAASYQGNLTYDMERAKIESVAAKFTEVFGFAPQVHRAGRFGCGPNTFRILKELGIQEDFSPSALFDFSETDGPDFSSLTSEVFVDQETDVRCFPVTGLQFVSGPDWFTGLLHQTGLFNILPSAITRKDVRLTPEDNGADRLKVLTKSVLAGGVTEFVFTIHATSLLPAGNQYATTENDVAATLRTTEAYLDYFMNTLSGRPAALSEPRPADLPVRNYAATFGAKA